MASLPIDTAIVATAKRNEQPAEPKRAKVPREAAATSGWRHLLFGSGPFCYRLLRFCQRSSR